jgi:hypothetical protein
MVLLDAAKGCGTAPPDLTRFPADFVAISFYKVNIHLSRYGQWSLYFSGMRELCSFVSLSFSSRTDDLFERRLIFQEFEVPVRN